MVLAFLWAHRAHAKPIKVVTISDLDFGSAVHGDPALTVPAATSETMNNASFKVSGDANRAYTITMPSSISMTTGGGGAGRTITVNGFTSYPPAGANGVLDAIGDQMLYVGATRAAISFSQVAGAYAGSFSVTVIY